MAQQWSPPSESRSSTLVSVTVLIDSMSINTLSTKDVEMEAIRWFGEIGLTDVGLVGGKGANLGELTTAGLPVPPGFVVTAAAFLEAISESGARARLARLLSELNADDPISLTQTRRAAREEIMATPSQLKSQTLYRTHIASSGTISLSRCGRRERPRMPATARSPG
jgi:hypothetical protein